MDGWELSEVESAPISSLLLTGSPRSNGENPEHVRLIAELGTGLPPIIVHRPTMRVVDGMHRLRAARDRSDVEIAVRYFDGDERDAFVLAVQSNVTHGLPLSADDRAAAALHIIRSHPSWSDRAIASIAGLSDKTVKKIRSAVGEAADEPEARVGRDGRRRPIDAAASRLKAKEWIERKPDASSREIAQLAGVSPATVRDVKKRLTCGDSPLPVRQQRAQGDPPARLDRSVRLKKAATSHAVAGGGSEDFARALDSLMRDPSLKLTEHGRTLLRGLSLHLPLREHQAELAEAVPQHRAGMFSELARTCAAVWLRLAEDAEQRASAAKQSSK